MRPWGLWLFFALTFGYTWGVAAFYILAPATAVAWLGPISFTNLYVFAAVWSPTLAGIFSAFVADGMAGLRDLFSRIFRWRIGWTWYAIAIVGTISLALAARYLASFVAGVSPPPVTDFASWPSWITFGLLTFVGDPGPLGEDPGWRGFALSRMLARWSPLTTAIVLGVIWGVWHIPAFYVPGMPQTDIPLVWFMIGIVSVSVLMTWVAMNTGGSVIPLILIHWAFNRFADLTPIGAFYTALVFTVAALVVVAATRGRLRHKPS